MTLAATFMRIDERARSLDSSALRCSSPSPSGEAQTRWWIKQYFLGKPRSLDRHLRSLGMSREILHAVAHVGARSDFCIDETIHIAATGVDRSEFDESRLPASLYGVNHLCGPLIRTASAQISRALPSSSGSLTIDVASIRSGFEEFLARRLSVIVTPTILVEANLHRLGCPDDMPADSRLEAFARRFETAERRRAFWAKYPVVLRLASAVATNAGFSASEAIRRLLADWPVVRNEFCLNHVSELRSIRWGSGDSHRGGQVVAMLDLDTATVVYKPRPMDIDVAYDRFLAWYASHAGGPIPARHRVLDMGGYGYSEFVVHRPAADLGETSRFYHRLGQLACIAWTLGVTDLHHENLVASGEDPYLVDVEAAGYRRVSANGRRSYWEGLSHAFNELAFGTGLLPVRIKGEDGVVDMSAIGSVSKQYALVRRAQIEGYGTDEAHLVVKRAAIQSMQNAPAAKGKTARPFDHLNDLQAGFDAACDLLTMNRAEALAADGPVEGFRDCVTRWVGRQTQDYADLLEKAVHPSVARDAAECDMMLAGSLRGTLKHLPHLESLISAEMECLWSGDIPYFAMTLGSRGLLDARGVPIDDYFEDDGLQGIRRRFGDLAANRQVHKAAIDAALRSTVSLEIGPTYSRIEHTPDLLDTDFLAAAREIAARIMSETLYLDGIPYGVGITPLDLKQYTAAPLPADVYDGLPGMGIFMAYLGRKVGDSDYLNFASNTHRLVRKLIAGTSGPVACGAFNGLSGLIYADLHLSSVLGEPFSIEAKRALRRLAKLAAADTFYDVISGASGAILVAMRVYRHTGDADALEVASKAARGLAQAAEHTNNGGAAWHTLKIYENRLGGFAHGVTGIALSLREWNLLDPREEWRELVRAAYTFEQSLFDDGAGNWKDTRQGENAHSCFWCYGAPGIGMAMDRMRDILGERACDEVLERAVSTTWLHGVVNSQCLCHGNLGNAELFRVAGELDKARSLSAGALQDRLTRGIWQCGLPADATTPGLMCGLAGIGYGLLRHVDASLPNILLLDGPPSL